MKTSDRRFRFSWQQLLAVLACTALLWAVLLPIASSANYRMDSEHIIHQPEETLRQYISENRGGLVLLLRLLGLDRWNPVRSGVLYLCFFTLSAWALVGFLRRLTRWQSPWLYLLFFLLYALSQIWAFHAYFVLQIGAVGLAMLLCTLIAGMDSLFFDSPRKPALRVGWEAAALLILGFCLTVYQALITHFLAVWLLLLFCFLYRGGRVSVSTFVFMALRLVLALVLYTLISRALRQGVDAAYIEGQIHWGSYPLFHCLLRIAMEVGASILMVHSRAFSLYPLAAVLLVLLYLRRRGSLPKPGRVSLLLVSLGLLLIPFAMAVLVGNTSVPRAQFSLQLVAAFVPVFFLAQSQKPLRVLKAILIAAVAVQCALSLRLWHTDNVRNQLDTEAGERICADLESADPSLPLITHGVLMLDTSPVTLERTDTYGLTFFGWLYKEDQPGNAVVPLVRLINAINGKVYSSCLEGPLFEEAMERAASMPCYPEPGYMLQTDRYTLINLSR